jgi:hypothetical protein
MSARMGGPPCLRLGRILIDAGIGRPVAIKPARWAHAEEIGVFRFDCYGHAFRKGKTIALSESWRTEFVLSRFVVLAEEIENLSRIGLVFTGDDWLDDARGFRHWRQKERENCETPAIVHELHRCC